MTCFCDALYFVLFTSAKTQIAWNIYVKLLYPLTTLTTHTAKLIIKLDSLPQQTNRQWNREKGFESLVVLSNNAEMCCFYHIALRLVISQIVSSKSREATIRNLCGGMSKTRRRCGKCVAVEKRAQMDGEMVHTIRAEVYGSWKHLSPIQHFNVSSEAHLFAQEILLWCWERFTISTPLTLMGPAYIWSVCSLPFHFLMKQLSTPNSFPYHH